MAVKLIGLQPLLSTFREADSRFNKAVAQELEAGAKKIAAKARQYAPENTGALIRTIRALRVNNSRNYAWQVKVGGISGGTDTRVYAEAAHEGYSTNRKSWSLSKKSLAKGAKLHYLKVAYEELLPSIKENIQKALKNEIENMG